MQKIVASFICCVMTVAAASCTTAQLSGPRGTGFAPPGGGYNGPKARIAIGDFEDKTVSSGHFNGDYGRGMRDILATALVQTGRFDVLEREKLQAVLAEQDLGASGRVRAGTAARVGELKGAELMVLAAVTAYEPESSGGSVNVGSFLGALNSNLGRAAAGFNNARAAIDLRLVDTATGQLVGATTVEGSATGLSGALDVAKGVLGTGASGYASTPIQRAIRDMIHRSVDFIVGSTPAQYYRF